MTSNSLCAMDIPIPGSPAESKMAGKLYIALEDLKERYRNEEGGHELMKAYVKSLEESRNIADIEVLLKENLTVEFVISGSESGVLQEIKQDILGEFCMPKSAKKYQQPSRYLPSANCISTKVSDEVCKEMNLKDQRRLHLSGSSKVSTLTVEALEAHDSRRAGPCQLRQFGCPICMHSWWHNVLRSKPVSRCRGSQCGNLRYDALPRCKEFGVGRFLCPNVSCGRRFFGYCEATDILRCRKCGTPSVPYVHPKWRKKKSGLNPRAKAFYPQFKNEHSLSVIVEDSDAGEDLGLPDIDADDLSFPDIGRLIFKDTALEPDLVAESLSICSTTDVSEANGNVSEADDNVSVADGNVSEVDGNVPEADGNVSEADGNVSEAGDVSEADGNVSEAGDVSEADGDVSEAGGDVPEAGSAVSEEAGIKADSEAGDELSQASSDWLLPDTRSTATLSDSDDDDNSSCSSSLQQSQGDDKDDNKYDNKPLPTPEVQCQPYRRRIFNASKVHEPTGGTVSTFLTQVDFKVAGEEVILDYDVDVGNDKVGACKFECAKCENEYTVICRMQDTAECFNCHASNRPLNWAPARGALPSKGTLLPDSKHTCSRCLGKGHCPNLLA